MAKTKKQGAPKNSNNILIGIGALIVALLLFTFLKPDGSELKSNGHDKDEMSDEMETENTATNFDYMLRDEWDGLERAEKNIQSLGEGQVIESGIIQDPTDENIVYFSSASFDEEAQESFVSVYRYDNSDYTFERLYKNTFGLDSHAGQFNGESYAGKYGVFGYDSGRLLISVIPHTSDNSCGQWFQGLIIEFDSLSIDDPYSGLEKISYTDLPEGLSRINEQRTDDCSEKR